MFFTVLFCLFLFSQVYICPLLSKSILSALWNAEFQKRINAVIVQFLRNKFMTFQEWDKGSHVARVAWEEKTHKMKTTSPDATSYTKNPQGAKEK